MAIPTMLRLGDLVIQLILVCLGLGQIFILFPEVQSVLKIICAITEPEAAPKACTIR